MMHTKERDHLNQQTYLYYASIINDDGNVAISYTHSAQKENKGIASTRPHASSTSSRPSPWLTAARRRTAAR